MKIMIRKKNSSIPAVLINAVFILFSLFCIIPVVCVLSVSLSDETMLATNGFSLLPQGLTGKAYVYCFRGGSTLMTSYLITIAVTALGTLLHLLITSLLAYSVSRREVRYRNAISLFVFFTVLFNGGLIPYYVLITKYLMLKNTFTVLVVVGLVSPINMLIMKNFFMSVPDAVLESARIDGSGEYRTFFKIVIPLSTPVFATIALFVALGYWNDWMTCALFINNQNLYTLQFLLQSIMTNIGMLMQHGGLSQAIDETIKHLPNESAKMATCVLSIGPIIFLYPFLQKFFVKGLTLGAVKA